MQLPTTEPVILRFLIAAVLAGGLWPIGTALRGRGSALIGLAALGAALVATAALLFAAPRAPDPVVDRPIETPVESYVSSDACRACHPQHYDSWHRSYHRTMTQVATPETVRGDFDDVRLRLAGYDLLLHREGDRFLATPLDAEGRPAAVDREIRMITGSHHMQIYWAASGDSRKMMLFPFVYLLAERRWIPRDAAFLEPPDARQAFAPGAWNKVCIQCHATHGRPRLDSGGAMDTRVGEFGIACEACHGPAEQHVRDNRAPGRRYRMHFGEQTDETIVDPSSLAASRASQVCGQCHAVFLPHDAEGLRRWNDEGFAYRPGDELAATRLIVRGYQDQDHPALARELRRAPHTFEDRFWSDGMVRVSGREYNGLIESPCYLHGDEDAGVMSCFSCHAMHPAADDPRALGDWADDQLAEGMRTNLACVQCHAEYETIEAQTAHSRHARGSSGNLCYNCHMPHTTYGLLKAIRSHQVDSPSTEASLSTGRPNACNLCHLDRSLGWAADALGARHGIEVPAMSPADREVSAAVGWMLEGDAGQRALVAWAAGWEPAQEASGTDWMVPYLAQLLLDPYHAVRFIAHRSLQSLPEAGAFEYDFLASVAERERTRESVVSAWAAVPRALDRPAPGEVLFDERGALRVDAFERLLRQRDDRRINLAE